MPVRFKNGLPENVEPIPDGVYYTTKEFAEKHDVPESTVRVWVMRGLVEAKSCFGRIYIPENVRKKSKKV